MRTGSSPGTLARMSARADPERDERRAVAIPFASALILCLVALVAVVGRNNVRDPGLVICGPQAIIIGEEESRSAAEEGRQCQSAYDHDVSAARDLRLWLTIVAGTGASGAVGAATVAARRRRQLVLLTGPR